MRTKKTRHIPTATQMLSAHAADCAIEQKRLRSEFYARQEKRRKRIKRNKAAVRQSS